MAHVERYRGDNLEYRFRVVASNGRKLSGSSEGYHQEDDRERCIDLTLEALIKDAGAERMKKLKWRRIDAAADESLFDRILAGAPTPEEAIHLYAALLEELTLLATPMVDLLRRAELPLSEFEQLGELARLEAIRSAFASTRSRPGETFVRDRALQAYWILTRRV